MAQVDLAKVVGHESEIVDPGAIWCVLWMLCPQITRHT